MYNRIMYMFNKIKEIEHVAVHIHLVENPVSYSMRCHIFK